ncbi:MAG: oligosaccharide flippase family protein [Vampirovibrionales bacterium]|nr:oligosaccharide flippase family protein [Vampirovibrionales bacterium]
MQEQSSNAKKSNMGRRFFLGATTGVIGLGIKTLLNIIVYPYILQTLGVEQYGLYVLLLNIADLIILMDLGLTSGIIQRLSTFKAAQENNPDCAVSRQATHQLLSTGLVLYAVLAILSFLIAFSLVPLVPNFFNLNAELSAIASFTLYIVLLESALTLFQGYFASVLMSHNLHQWVNTGESLYFITANGCIFILLHMGYGLREIALLRLGAATIKFLLVFSHAVRHEPDCIKPTYFNFHKAIDLLKVSVHAMIRTVSDIFANRMDLIIIGRMLSLRDVATLEFVYRFFNIILQIPTQITLGIFPVFTRMIALGNHTQARLVFLRLSCFLQVIVSILIAVLCIFYPEIFKFFSGGRIDYQATIPLLILAIPGVISTAVYLPASHYLFAAGRFKLISGGSVFIAILKVVLVLMLIKPMGLLGVVLSTFIIDIIYHQILLIRQSCKDLSIGFWEYSKDVHLINIPVLLAATAAIYGLKQAFALMSLHPMLQAVLATFIMLPAAMIAWFLMSATQEEKAICQTALSRVLLHRPGRVRSV